MLAQRLADLAAVTVVAPDRNRSGASNSLTLETPLRVERAHDNVYYVNGTPTDCVHVAVTGLLEHPPDMIVSGINHGANLGDDVLYSGTVAAAMEGRFLGIPAIAVSLVLEGEGGHFATAADFVCRLVARTLNEPLPADSILNVNVPDLGLDEIKGVRTTRLGFRHKSEPVIRALDQTLARARGGHADAVPGLTVHRRRPSQASSAGSAVCAVRSTLSGDTDTQPLATAWKSVPGPASWPAPAGPIQ